MALSRITLAGLVALLVAGVAGAAGTGDAAPVNAAVDCTPAGLVLSQAPDGHVDACLRLGNLASGPHTISLQDLLAFGPPPRKVVRPGGTPGVEPTPPPSEPVVALSLSPASGGPGTVVTVTGRLGKPFHPRDSHPNLCWDGCQEGLGYGDVPMRWTSPRTFRATLVVPAAPWIGGGPPHVAPLVSGDYAVAIQCIREARGCTEATEGTATFHLHVTRPVGWCRTQATCARLRVTPARALPGQVVRVTGFVPLAQGAAPGAGSTFELQAERRRPHTSEVRFTGRHGVEFATVGLGAVDVEAPPSYADLHEATPLGQVSDAVPQISADPADTNVVAWCAGQTIATSGPGGLTLIPAATAKSALKALGFSFRFDPQPACAAVAPMATSTGAPAGLAAAFYVTTAAGAPPFFLAALVTRDQGRTWAPIPVPRGSGPAGFGGFRYGSGGTLQALFAVSLKSPIKNYPQFDPDRALSEISSSDGQSFSQAPPGCPAVGPCVTFGLFQAGNCAMNGTMQTLVRSTDGGNRWSPLDFPYAVQACGAAEIVATSPTAALLVDSTSTYPVLRTTDGGASWQDISIPRPGARGNITVLPDGSMLLADGLGYSGRWKLLRRGAHRWCTLRSPARALQRAEITPVTAISADLWWLTGPLDNPDGSPKASHLAISALSC